MYSESGFAAVPAVCRFPHVDGEEESLFAFDVFHTVHLGIGKSNVGSCMVLLAEQFDASNMEGRFAALEAQFFQRCKANHETPVIIRLSRETLQWFTSADYTSGNWFKGSVTTVK